MKSSTERTKRFSRRRDNGSQSSFTNPQNGQKSANGSVIDRKVLLLNQNYEPLTVCTARRAIVMIFMGTVQIVDAHETLGIRSVSAFYKLPSVVKLETYVKSPYRQVILNRKNLLLRDGHKCQYCGVRAPELTVDHVIPRQKGGRDTWENLVCACTRCNARKGDRAPEKSGMKLLKKPRRPHRLSFIRLHASKANGSWRPYLFMD